jgi:hypothetical protein
MVLPSGETVTVVSLRVFAFPKEMEPEIFCACAAMPEQSQVPASIAATVSILDRIINLPRLTADSIPQSLPHGKPLQ